MNSLRSVVFFVDPPHAAKNDWMQQKWRRVLELLHVGPIGRILTKKLVADWEMQLQKQKFPSS
jgi:hypothetical protein